MPGAINHKRLFIFDSLVILLNFTYGMSMLKVWLLDPIPIPSELSLLFITSISYIIRFGAKSRLVLKKSSLLWLLVIIYLADFIQNAFIEPGLAFWRFVLFCDIYIFMEYLYGVYIEAKQSNKNAILVLSTPIEYYALYNIVAVILSVLLISFGVLSETDNPLQPNSLTYDNQVNFSGQYYFPGYLSLIIDEFRGLAFLGIPTLTGLSHEPHVLFLLIGPAFFLLLNRYSKLPLVVLLVYISYLFVMVAAASATAVLTLALCILIEQMYSFFIGGKKASHLLIIVVIVFIGVALYSFGGDLLFEGMGNLMSDKLSTDNTDGSGSFSYSMFRYMVTPEALFGRGNIPVGSGFMLNNQDIGLLTCFLDLVFFASMFFLIVKNALSKNSVIHFWGMAFLYFFIHMQKLSVLVFRYPYVAFFVVGLIILDRERKMIVNNEIK